MTADEITADWPVELKVRLGSYFAQQRIDARDVLRVDIVLALLRLGELERVQELTGRPITKCPSGVPPWPPVPPKATARSPVVSMIGTPPCASTEMAARFASVRKGMTKAQLLARGVTQRDIRYWEKTKRIEFTPKGAIHGKA
jgi:hypothetical protein